MKNLKFILNFPIAAIALIVAVHTDIFCQQSIWTKTLSYDYGWSFNNVHDSMSVGPYGFAPRNDGSFYILCNDHQDGIQSLYLVDSMGNFNSVQVGYYQTLQYWRALQLRPAPGNGCTFIVYHNDFGGLGLEEYYLYRVYGLGLSNVGTWQVHQGVGDVLSDAIANYHGGYYCLVNNYWIDYPVGDTMDFNHLIHIFQNDNFLYADTALTRKDLTGNILWSVPSNGYQVISVSEYSIYAKKDSLRKFNVTNGNIIWTKPLQFSDGAISNPGNDGIVMANFANRITSLDSSANLLGQDTIDIARFGISALGATSDGSIITGGSFYSGRHYASYHGFSPIIIKLDALTNCSVKASDLFFVADADHDGYEEFADDAVFIAAALGKSNGHPDMNNISLDRTSITYAPDWDDSFPNGLNYKFCDLNSDGNITEIDLQYLSNSFLPSIYSHHNLGAIDTAYLLTDNPAPNIGDTFSIAFVLGSPLNPIDSIYGISITIRDGWFNIDYTVWDIEFRNGGLGDTATNLFYQVAGNGVKGIVICRTDNQNTLTGGDTLFVAKAKITNLCCLVPYTIDFTCHAITKDGNTVPLKEMPVLFGPTTSIMIPVKIPIQLFPNPTNEILNLNGVNSPDKIVIINSIGGVVLSKTNNLSSIDVSGFTPGIYHLQIFDDDQIIQKEFIVQH